MKYEMLLLSNLLSFAQPRFDQGGAVGRDAGETVDIPGERVVPADQQVSPPSC